MLKGANIIFSHHPSFLFAADTSSEDLENNVSVIAQENKFFSSFKNVTSIDIITNKNAFENLHKPMIVFMFITEEDRSKFLSHYKEQIEVFIASDLDWEQSKMFAEDEARLDLMNSEISELEQLASGDSSKKLTIAKLYGIDKEDKWDTRTDKEKAQDLLEADMFFSKMVGEGKLTQEAVAPDFEQTDAKKDKIDIDNIPPELAKMFSDNGLTEDDVKREVEKINELIEEFNKSLEEDNDSTRFSHDSNGNVNGVYIRATPNKPTGDDSPKDGPSLMDDVVSVGLSQDDIIDALKPSEIDGRYINDFDDYIFKNTSGDSYDYKEFTESLNPSTKNIDMTVDQLPINIGKKSSIDYSNVTFIETKVSQYEEETVYSAKIDIDKENIVGSSNIENYNITDDVLSVVFKDSSKESYLVVTKDNITTVIKLVI